MNNIQKTFKVHGTVMDILGQLVRDLHRFPDVKSVEASYQCPLEAQISVRTNENSSKVETYDSEDSDPYKAVERGNGMAIGWDNV